MQHTNTPAQPARLAARRASTGPILVASDGAAASAGAFGIARLLAERTDAGVHVVSALAEPNVVVPPMDSPASLQRPGASRVEERRAELELLAHGTAVEAARWPVEIVLGDPIPSIVQVAAERVAPLVVTGHTHHGMVERLVRRETPLGIARAARVPVLAVPPAMTHLPRSVVVAVELGDAGAHVSDVAGALFSEAVAVHLAHVREPALPRHERVLRAEEEADDRAVERAFERARAGWRLPADVSTVTHVLVGKPSEALQEFAASVAADLVVVGLTVAAHAAALPHRSLAARLYREWPKALLLVPIGGSE
ncbi:MAG TPA: universal stress protein [Gemmatimonadaceae bacterium]|nr:universal stress protein [Gemmatimonadaceae bacterium]